LNFSNKDLYFNISLHLRSKNDQIDFIKWTYSLCTFQQYQKWTAISPCNILLYHFIKISITKLWIEFQMMCVITETQIIWKIRKPLKAAYYLDTSQSLWAPHIAASSRSLILPQILWMLMYESIVFEMLKLHINCDNFAL
jgi:hypothetical protein